MAAVALVPIRRPVFCGARRKQGPPGASCRRPAGWGTDHVGWGSCKLHGGCVPTHGRSVATAQAREVAALFGVPRDDINEIDGLIEELGRSAGLIDAYEAMCVQLMPDEVVFGVVSTEETRPSVDSSDGQDLAPTEVKTRSGAALNVWVKLLNEERDRFIRLCEAMVKLDLERRRVDIDQSHVSVLVSILMSSEMGLSPDQLRVAARLMRGVEQDTIEGSIA